MLYEQLIVFAALNVLQWDKKDPACRLLRSIQSYNLLSLYISFEVHTAQSIQAGRQELEKFGGLMKVKFITFFIYLKHNRDLDVRNTWTVICDSTLR